jgi:hypothetical protein
MAGHDLAEVVTTWLRTDPTCTGLRNLIVNSGAGGRDNVLEAGEVTEEVLNEQVATRREDPTQANRVLAVSVQDDGEEKQSYNDGEQFIVIRIYDRGKGYHNIREVRRLLIDLMRGAPFAFTSGCGIALKGMAFSVRSGHRWDRTYNIEYEALRWIGKVYYQKSQYE